MSIFWLSVIRVLSSFCVFVATQTVAAPRTVYFPSADGKTELVAYVFAPNGAGPHPAVVMMHGRAGPYSSNVNTQCTGVARSVASACGAATLSRRHVQWGEFWAARGFLALHVDSFGPRGKAHGFGQGTHDDAERDNVNERTVRPIDALDALKFLRSLPEVDIQRVFLQGWSNGASTVLNVMLEQSRAPNRNDSVYHAALAFYPGCGPRALIDQQRYTSSAPLTVFLGSDDEEVSPNICRTVLERAHQRGAPIEVVWYDGATHNFDDPGKERQSVAGNRAATVDSIQRAARAFR